jgi:hypothetical protein
MTRLKARKTPPRSGRWPTTSFGAREDGAAGAPPQNGADWSTAERDVLALLAEQRRHYEAARASIAERAEQDLIRLAPPAFDPGAACAQAQVDLRLVGGRLGPDLAASSARARRAQQQLESFREAHGMARPAIYPASRVLQAGLLLLAAGFESVFSAALFAENDERGLLGDALAALGLSGANFTLGFLAGFLGLRNLGARETIACVIGAAGLIVLTTFLSRSPCSPRAGATCSPRPTKIRSPR